jgi:hypothetical protein
MNQFSLRAFPLPLAGTVDTAAPDAEKQWVRAHYWDLLAARPEVPALWAAAALAGLLALTLHVRALRGAVPTQPPPGPVSLEDAETAVSPAPRSPAPRAPA